MTKLSIPISREFMRNCLRILIPRDPFSKEWGRLLRNHKFYDDWFYLFESVMFENCLVRKSNCPLGPFFKVSLGDLKKWATTNHKKYLYATMLFSAGKRSNEVQLCNLLISLISRLLRFVLVLIILKSMPTY